MSADDPTKPVELHRRHSHLIAFSLLSVGLALALAANVCQFVRTEHLARDLVIQQRSISNQIAEVREAQAAMLEQNLRRYETLSRQVPAMAATAIEEARSAVHRSNSRLARAFTEKHESVVNQLSELESNTNTSSKLNQLSSDLDETRTELNRVVSDLRSGNADAAPASQGPAAAQAEVTPLEETAPAARKRTFWSKLNPFKRNRKKTEAVAYGQ